MNINFILALLGAFQFNVCFGYIRFLLLSFYFFLKNFIFLGLFFLVTLTGPLGFLMMKKKPPLDHPYVVAYEEWLALKTQVKDYLEFLFIPFPSCYWHYFLIIEFLLICRFAYAQPWAKTTKVEAD